MAKKDPMIGVKIDRIEIRERIGKGGMGSVYKGWHSFLQKFVAVKMMSSELSENQDFVQRFMREAQSLARVSHPNVVQVHDAGEFDEQYYIVMEFIEGVGLDQFILANKPTYKQAISILRKCVGGLQAAYKEKIIHRDIKPANIMITSDGSVKVTDFGLAKTVDSTMGITHTGQIMGTPQFISPEQCSGGDVDFRTDIYSLGAMFYRMVTGKFPFAGNTPFEVMRQHLQEPLTPPQEHNDEIPDGISTVICKMMEKKPENRFSSYEALDTTLSQLENDSDIGAGFLSTIMENVDLPSTGATIESVQNKKYTAAFALIGFLLLGVIGGMGYYIFQLKQKKEPVPEPTPEPVVEKVEETEEEPVPEPVVEDPVVKEVTPQPEPEPENPPEPDPEQLKKEKAAKVLEELLELAEQLTIYTAEMEFEKVTEKLPVLEKKLADNKDLIDPKQYSLLEISIRDPKTALNEYNLYSKAENAFSSGKYEESRKLFRNQLQEFPRGRFKKDAETRMEVLSGREGKLIEVKRKIKDNNFKGAEQDIAALEKTLPKLQEIKTLRNEIQEAKNKISQIKILITKIENLIRGKDHAEAKQKYTVLKNMAASINYSLPMADTMNRQITFLESAEKAEKLALDEKTAPQALTELLNAAQNVFSTEERTRVDTILKDIEEKVLKPFIIDLVRKRKMVLIPAGTFTMGTDNPGFRFSSPAHKVTITRPFYMDNTEVTNREFELFRESHKSERLEYANSPGIPVTNVTFQDTVEFTKWLFINTGQKYRLPTEAEWEYAARGGTTKMYSTAEINIASRGPETAEDNRPNAFGLYHMSGNVWEICQDTFAPYKGEPQTDPGGVIAGKPVVMRGGAFNLKEEYKAALASVFGRGMSLKMGKKSYSVGFRCVREVDIRIHNTIADIKNKAGLNR